MIKMLGLVENRPVAVQKDIFDEMIKNTERSLGLTEDQPLSKTALKKIVKEEYNKLIKDLSESAPSIDKKLNEVRTELFKEYFKREKIGSTFKERLEKRIQLKALSEMIDVPVNELLLFFLNNIKTMNERSLYEYRLGHIYFYAD